MGIIDRDPGNFVYANVKVEADVIVSATVIGFAATRALLAEPFAFTMQDDPANPDKFLAEFAKWGLMLDTVEQVLRGLHRLVAHNTYASNLRPEDLRDATRDLVAPTSDDISNRGRDNSITGRPGGDALHDAARWRRPWMNFIEGTTPEYAGRGAYTGVCDDPMRVDRWINPAVVPDISTIANINDRDYLSAHPMVPKVDPVPRMPTVARAITPTTQRDMGRYKPTDITAWVAAKGPILDPQNSMYGEIAKSNTEPPPVGLGLVVDKQKIAGYAHGMCQAIVEANKRGPWCVAHEHAIGLNTTKLASCFACTTFMYAAGYPPSACHIGRAESWVPPNETVSDAATAKLTSAIDARWHTQCFYYLLLGARLLQDYFRADGLRNPNNGYVKIVDDLLAAIATQYRTGSDTALSSAYDMAKVIETGGNFFLDALVIHESENVRLMNVLGLTDVTPEGLRRYQEAVETQPREDRATYEAAIGVVIRDVRTYLPDWARTEYKRQKDEIDKLKK